MWSHYNYSKLQNLHKIGSKFSGIQRTCDTIEKILRELEAQGESIDEQRTLIQQIISKFPAEVVVKLEESKEPVRPWTMPSLRDAIHHYITVHENVQHYLSNSNNHVKGQPFMPNNNNNNTGHVKGQPFMSKQSKHWTDHTTSAEVLTTNSYRRKEDGSLTCSDQETAHCLNDFFTIVFTTEPEGDLPSSPDKSKGHCLSNITITYSDILYELN